MLSAPRRLVLKDNDVAVIHLAVAVHPHLRLARRLSAVLMQHLNARFVSVNHFAQEQQFVHFLRNRHEPFPCGDVYPVRHGGSQKTDDSVAFTLTIDPSFFCSFLLCNYRFFSSMKFNLSERNPELIKDQKKMQKHFSPKALRLEKDAKSLSGAAALSVIRNDYCFSEYDASVSLRSSQNFLSCMYIIAPTTVKMVNTRMDVIKVVSKESIMPMK